MENQAAMYEILEQMVGAAERRDKDRVFELNEEFSKLLPPVSHCSPELCNYDNCRQSSMSAFTMPHMYDRFVEDARQRLQSLSKP